MWTCFPNNQHTFCQHRQFDRMFPGQPHWSSQRAWWCSCKVSPWQGHTLKLSYLKDRVERAMNYDAREWNLRNIIINPFGQLWDNFRTILGQLWDILETTLGQLWDNLGTTWWLLNDYWGMAYDHLWIVGHFLAPKLWVFVLILKQIKKINDILIDAINLVGGLSLSWWWKKTFCNNYSLTVTADWPFWPPTIPKGLILLLLGGFCFAVAVNSVLNKCVPPGQEGLMWSRRSTGRLIHKCVRFSIDPQSIGYCIR